MNHFPELKIWVRFLIVFVVIILAGISPLSKEYSHALNQAQQAINHHDYLQAAQFYAEAAKLVPWRTDLWVSAGKLALQSGNAQQAIRYLDQIANQGKLTQEGELILAEAYHQAGDHDLAVKYWQNALEKGASPNQLYPQMLNAQLCAGDYSDAIRTLEKLVDLEPAEAQWKYQLGLLLASQEPGLAITYLEQAAELEPDLSQAAYKLSGVIETKILSDQPAYVLVESGRTLATMEEWELAAEAFKQATSHNPNYADAWAYYGEALQHLDQPRDNPELDTPEQIMPTNCRGTQLWQTDLSRKSQQALEHAFELDPDSLTANLFLALFYKRENQFELATESLIRANKIDPDNPIIETELGNIQAIQGDLAAALKQYQQAIQVSHDDPTYTRLLLEFIIQNRYQLEETGLPAARRLVAQYPREAENMTLLGQVQALLEDYWSAEISFTAAIQIDDEYALAYLQLGELYYAQRKLAQAQDFIEKAYTLSPASMVGEQAQYLLKQYFP